MNQDLASSAGFRKREAAKKVMIKDTLSAQYAQGADESPGGIMVEGAKANRVSIIGVIIDLEAAGLNTVLLDDGTGIVRVAVFDDIMFRQLRVGDAAMVVGRVREYGGERSISAEIARKVNSLWGEVRKRELAGRQDRVAPVQKQREESEEKADDAMTRVYEVVKRLDTGNGAERDAVVAAAKVGNADLIITSLLEAGDLFEAQPGRLKTLE